MILSPLWTMFSSFDKLLQVATQKNILYHLQAKAEAILSNSKQDTSQYL